MRNTSLTLTSPLQLPLRGSALIEASAGTGKTFTIAAAYVRFVLAHISDRERNSAWSEALLPTDILVVTFTKAATAELKERIRSRLVEAANWFRDTETVEHPDRFLTELRQCYDRDSWPGCARALQVASEWMDEAAVSTIHSWCQGMLREHAFSSGSLFSQELSTELEPFKLEAVRDYWRNFYYPLAGDEYAQICKHWKTPEALYTALKEMWSLEPDGETGALDLAAINQVCEARCRTLLTPLKEGWRSWADEIIQFVERAESSGYILNKRKLSAKKVISALEPVKAWAADEAAVDIKIPASMAGHLTHAGLSELCDCDIPSLPGLGQLETLQTTLKSLPGIRSDLIGHALPWVKKRFKEQLHSKALMGFDDIIQNMRDALAGEQGEKLAQLIREQFPVAMVDEFQDTDPDQYAIFNAVYQIAQNRQDTGVYLIGDPKQAIYAFRGADIFTYLRARRDTVGRHYTLATNYRSVEPMVKAANEMFLAAEQKQPRKAFMFSQQDDNPVPYVAVGAAGRKEKLIKADGSEFDPLRIWTTECDSELTNDEYLHTQANSFADYIAWLLNEGVKENVGIRSEAGFEPLQSRHIAVLVNNKFEAGKMQQALNQRNVTSVYLSDNNSVFDAEIASDLLSVLEACAAPGDGKRMMVALSTPLLNISVSELDQLRHNDRLWDQRMDQFYEFAQKWQQQGVLAMIHSVLHQFEVPQRLKTALRGERILTDLLHLAELLQQAASRLEGEQALLRYFHDQIFSQDRAVTGDEQLVRLESEAELVQIVTIHKSKGLEYPLVFIPFISSCKPLKAARTVSFHDQAGNRRLVSEPDEQTRIQADEERLGEDIRKLYVAVTRARFACWIGLAAVKNWQKSALAYLASADCDFIQQARSSWSNGLIQVVSAPTMELQLYQPTDNSTGHVICAQMPAERTLERWWIASYSALKYGAAGEPESAQEANLLEDVAEPFTAELDSVQSAGDLHQLPRGAGPGTFLHTILEDAARVGFKQVADDPAVRRELLELRCRNNPWSEHLAVLDNWLQNFLCTELILPEGSTVALSQLAQYKAEPEFWFTVTGTNAVAVDKLVTQFISPGKTRPTLLNNYLNGMLKGFIDLIFEYNGRYFVADYKSNYLGPDDSFYTHEHMHSKILASRYELQYVIYTLALHKLLQARLGEEYDYDRHIGGAVYIFLRGYKAQSRGVIVDRPPRALIEQLDKLLKSGGDANV